MARRSVQYFRDTASFAFVVKLCGTTRPNDGRSWEAATEAAEKPSRTQAEEESNAAEEEDGDDSSSGSSSSTTGCSDSEEEEEQKVPEKKEKPKKTKEAAKEKGEIGKVLAEPPHSPEDPAVPRVIIWDTTKQAMRAGPMPKNLTKYLKNNPHCERYENQDATQEGVEAVQGVGHQRGASPLGPAVVLAPKPVRKAGDTPAKPTPARPANQDNQQLQQRVKQLQGENVKFRSEVQPSPVAKKRKAAAVVEAASLKAKPA